MKNDEVDTMKVRGWKTIVNSSGEKSGCRILKGRNAPWKQSKLTSVNLHINLFLNDINFKMASLIRKTIAE